MRQVLGTMLLVGIASGCINMDGSPETGGARPNYGRSFGPPSVPGVEGPYGTPVPMAAPYNAAPPGSPWAAQQMMRNPVPLSMVQMNSAGSPMMGPMGGAMPNLPIPPGAALSPPGLPFAPGAPMGAPVGGPQMPMGPGGPPLGAMGMSPGNISRAGYQDGSPGSRVMQASIAPGGNPSGEVEQAQYSASSPVGALFPAQRTQVFITRPSGMEVSWYTQGKDGKPSYSVIPLYTPGRYNFAQGAIYRLKLAKIPGRERLELYPTLEVVPTSPKTNEFLAHNSVPLEFTEEDFKQVVDRNYIVKVIYLPDPQFQDVAGSGPDEIVSTRLEPGQDPIQEALRRGSILLIVRIGNIDQNVSSSPSLTAPVPGGGAMPNMMAPPGMMGVPPSYQVPYMRPAMPPGMMPPGMMPPGMMPPGMMPPGMLPPMAPGLGAEAERAKPNQLAPLPPLPNEQNNKNLLELPFGPRPEVPAKEGVGSAKPETKGDELAAPQGNTPAPNNSLPAFPQLPAPNLNLKEPSAQQPKTAPGNPMLPLVPPNFLTNKQEVTPKNALPEIPVSNPKEESGKVPALPPINLPPLSNNLLEKSKTSTPMLPVPPTAKSDSNQISTPVKLTTPKQGSTSVLPALPGLPPINPELMNGADIPLIPSVPSPVEKK